ncbi:hypothetical protein ABQX22_18145 [Xanthomonas sp. WHRI 1810A]|uniref:hypothetical protein n=1 Tax=Xanthomonas sp. WHRI 1810A TaxID=3161565 RepID=UPI0032E89948
MADITLNDSGRYSLMRQQLIYSAPSAAYWIASAGHEVVVDDTAMVLSVGVVVEVSVDADTGKGQNGTKS